MKVTTQNNFVFIETKPVSASVLVPHGLAPAEALRGEALARRSKAQRHLAYASLYEQAADQLEGKPAQATLQLTLMQRLQACIDDPMWPRHAEVSKDLLRQAVAALGGQS